MYYFTTSTDNQYCGEESFSSKVDGTDLIKDNVLKETFSKCNAFELIEEVINLEGLPVTNRKGDDPIQTAKLEEEDKDIILKRHSAIRRMALSETETGLPKFVFPSFEAGVCFVTKEEVFGVFLSKQEALEDEKLKEYLKKNRKYSNKFFSDLFEINFSDLRFDPQGN